MTDQEWAGERAREIVENWFHDRELLIIQITDALLEFRKETLEEHELERDLVSQLCYEILEWYHGDNDLMPQTLVDQLTAEMHRLVEKEAIIR